MIGNNLALPIHVPGTLSANVTVTFQLPFDVSLIAVSAVGSNANNGQLKVGHSTDDAAYLAFFDIGDSGVPVEKGRVDFVGGQYPHITKGTKIIATLDYDGASGTATQNFTAILTFTEG